MSLETETAVARRGSARLGVYQVEITETYIILLLAECHNSNCLSRESLH